jgi:Secreted and surface protein containing fasciclin-like repeats
VPLETRADQTYVWDRRGGEFISVVFSPEDPIATADSETTTHTLTVDASPDDIEPDTVQITAEYPNIAAQVGRLPSFSTLASLATSSGVAEVLGGDGPFTLLGPQNAALAGLDPAPTQATDPDEPATSSVLADILKYHAVPASVASGDISDGQTVSTLYGDQTLTFNASGGTITVDGAQVVRPDIPVTNENFHGVDGLLTPSTASVDFTDRSKDSAPAAGDTITVDGSFFPADVDANGGGFVVLHDSTELADQGALPSIVGKSGYVDPGVQNEIEVVLDEAISDTTTVGAMAHRDSDGDGTYDFETSGGTEDGPYTLSGSAVIDYGVIEAPN